MASLGIELTDLIQNDYRVTRQIGKAAYGRRLQALLSPSATGVDDVLVIFPENLRGSTLHAELVDTWVRLKDIPS